MRVLVIEDNEYLARALGRMLRDHDVTIELDPLRALERFAAAEQNGSPFDLVLCDQHMPGMLGVDVLQRLRASPNPPIMVLSTGIAQFAGCDAADAILVKPYRSDELRSTIDELLVARSSTRTARLRRVSEA